MRLLVLADNWGALGGGEVVAAQLAGSLAERFEVAVLSTDRQRESHARQDRLSIYRLKSEYPARLRPLLGLINPFLQSGIKRVLRDFRPDIVHAWNIHQHLSYASLRLARSSGAPTVLTFQDALPFCYTKYHCFIDRQAPCPTDPDYQAQQARCPSCWRHYWLFPPRNRAVRTLVGRHVSHSVAVSAALSKALSRNGLPEAQVIHNGLPLAEQPRPESEVAGLRQRFGLGDESVVAGGRMGWFKGQHVLLEAFARLSARRPAAQLVLAGRDDDLYAELLKRRSTELGVAERVIFTGFLPRSDFLALLQAGALFGSLSLYLDPFPTVNLEAGAAGLPVLGTCFGGTPEVVLDGETGCIVQPYRLEDVASALDGLLSDRGRLSRLGGRAAERIRTVFPLSAMVERYASLFDSMTEP